MMRLFFRAKKSTIRILPTTMREGRARVMHGFFFTEERYSTRKELVDGNEAASTSTTALDKKLARQKLRPAHLGKQVR